VRRRLSIAAFVAAGLALAAVLVLFVSPWADSNPDGLSKVSADKGIDAAQRAGATDGSPLSGYGVEGVGHDALSKGLSGLVGVAVTFLVAASVLWLVRRRRTTQTTQRTERAAEPGAA
jgi:cobalt/nickel transport system permease protein